MTPQQLHELFAEGLNAGDTNALASLYDADAILHTVDGPVRGTSAIREALASFVAMRPRITITTRKVAETGDTALLMADWKLQRTAADGSPVSTSGVSVEVARRQKDGSWRYLIDLPYGIAS